MKMKPKYLSVYFLVTHTFLMNSKVFLVFGGKSGWIGRKVVELINSSEDQAIPTSIRLENREEIIAEIERIKPDFVINAAGKTGTPNVDWCEDHKEETMRSNIIGALNLADICYLYKIHMTNIGTGCIYEYDKDHPAGSGKGFKENEEPNFKGSFYSKTKILLEELLLYYPNVLNLRLRMPISSDLHSRNFIVKISKYKKVINVPNSVSVLDDLLPLIQQMCKLNLTGAYNFVNPGVISHNEVLDLYKQYLNNSFYYENFTIEEQNTILKAKRSNNELDCSKLTSLFPQLPHIHKSIINVFEKIKLQENL